MEGRNSPPPAILAMRFTQNVTQGIYKIIHHDKEQEAYAITKPT